MKNRKYVHTHTHAQNHARMHVHTHTHSVDQVAQTARSLATGWTTRVRSLEAEGWRFFVNSSYPDVLRSIQAPIKLVPELSRR